MCVWSVHTVFILETIILQNYLSWVASLKVRGKVHVQIILPSGSLSITYARPVGWTSGLPWWLMSMNFRKHLQVPAIFRGPWKVADTAVFLPLSANEKGPKTSFIGSTLWGKSHDRFMLLCGCGCDGLFLNEHSKKFWACVDVENKIQILYAANLINFW